MTTTPERHGHCKVCHAAVHEYPYGIDHVNRPSWPHDPEPVWEATR